MGLSYHYAFSAPDTTPADALEDFLHEVEGDAKAMGFVRCWCWTPRLTRRSGRSLRGN